jgi:Beta protein
MAGRTYPPAKKAPKPTKTALRVARAQLPVPHPGLHFGPGHQFFVAKLKRGEIWALNHLSSQSKAAITPVFEMWPPNAAMPPKQPKALDQHVADLLDTLANEWGSLPSYIDSRYLQSSGSPSPQRVKTVFDIARSKSLNVVPVTSPLFPQSYQHAVREVIAHDGRGVMLRLPVSFFDDLENGGKYLTGLANVLKVKPSQIDILIDLEYRPSLAEVRQMGASCLDNLPEIAQWRTVTLASGCFPSTISSDPHGEWIPYERTDWKGWKAVAQQRSQSHQRVPSYGDYGVRCGGPPVSIPNGPDPNLRYAGEEIVWVRKGPKAAGVMRTICADLAKKKFFSGAAFSQGDADIAARATMTSSTNAQAEQWIQWCTNHHLELTASQIRNLPWT